jgi:hypothetical protein
MNDYRSDGTLPGHHATPEVTDQTTLARAAQHGAKARGETPHSDHRALPSSERTLIDKVAALGSPSDVAGRITALEGAVELLTTELHQLTATLKQHRYIA